MNSIAGETRLDNRIYTHEMYVCCKFARLKFRQWPRSEKLFVGSLKHNSAKVISWRDMHRLVLFAHAAFTDIDTDTSAIVSTTIKIAKEKQLAELTLSPWADPRILLSMKSLEYVAVATKPFWRSWDSLVQIDSSAQLNHLLAGDPSRCIHQTCMSARQILRQLRHRQDVFFKTQDIC